MQSPEEEARARARFIAINAIRIGGVAMILFGIAVVQRMVSLPEWIGFALLVFGVVETFLIPALLARVWNTNDRNPPRGPGER